MYATTDPSARSGEGAIRRRLSVVLVAMAALLASLTAPAGGYAGFGDVAAGRFYTEAVQWMVDNGITTGTSPTCFSPNDPVTRGQAAAFLWRMEGEPAAAPHPFGDVVAPWQQDAVSWMYAEGITTGTGPGTYSPDDVLTRGQLAALLYRLAGEPGGSPPHPFTDVTAAWQQDAIAWLFAAGITTGTSDTEFSPDRPVTRGELATFLYRYKLEPAVVVDETHPTSPTCADQVAGPNDGYESLFIGHSFFIPVAAQMADHGPAAGFPAHAQQTFFSGGSGGAPQALWENTANREWIQDILDDGDIELFGLTYHPTYPSIEGYQRWIEFALAQNPDTIVFVAIPWLTNPGSMTAAEFGDIWHGAHETLGHDLIDELRDLFPGTAIYDIPYGQAAVELYALFDAGDLPDVDRLVRSDGQPGIFSDGFGHGDAILIDLAALVWLRAIYGVELIDYDHDPGYETDLKAIADEIMDGHDPAYDAP